MKILISETSRTLSNALESILKSNGFEVVLSHDGIQTINLFTKDTDVLLIDEYNHRITYEEVINRIRFAKPEIKIILITDYPSLRENDLVNEMDIDILLPRPFKEEDLLFSFSLLDKVKTREKKFLIKETLLIEEVKKKDLTKDEIYKNLRIRKEDLYLYVNSINNKSKKPLLKLEKGLKLVK